MAKAKKKRRRQVAPKFDAERCFIESESEETEGEMERWRKRCNRCDQRHVAARCPNCRCFEFTVIDLDFTTLEELV